METPTCRWSNRVGHKAAECRNTLCFNCVMASATHHGTAYGQCLCKCGSHLAYRCPFSWLCSKAQPSDDHPPENNEEDPPASPEEVAMLVDASPGSALAVSENGLSSPPSSRRMKMLDENGQIVEKPGTNQFPLLPLLKTHLLILQQNHPLRLWRHILILWKHLVFTPKIVGAWEKICHKAKFPTSVLLPQLPSFLDWVVDLPFDNIWYRYIRYFSCKILRWICM